MSISCDGECHICEHYKNEYLLENDSIPKEAIREKMKQLEITDCTIRYDKYDIQDILKELLGE